MDDSPSERYRHTQVGRFHVIGVGAGLVLVTLGIARLLGLYTPDEDASITAVLLAGGAVLLLIGLMFRHLTIRDRGDALELRFGPIPLVGKRVSYDSIESVERARSRVIDGWGVHWVPGRGWTWNIHGFDCVELELSGGRRLRVGTDDPEGLALHLERATG